VGVGGSATVNVTVSAATWDGRNVVRCEARNDPAVEARRCKHSALDAMGVSSTQSRGAEGQCRSCSEDSHGGEAEATNGASAAVRIRYCA
jgi:hypothetical protein